MSDYQPSEAEKAAIALAPKMQMTCGACPVQIEGELLDGNYFYFRSRGESWYVEVAPTEDDLFDDKHLYYHEEGYGTKSFEAGYMPHNEAWAIVVAQLTKYQLHSQSQRGAA